MELKDVLAAFRREHKISQREFARRAGLSNSLISILEMGYNPQTGKKVAQSFETYKKIANAMGISLHELFEQLDDDEIVSLRPLFKDINNGEPWRVIVPDSELFRKIMEAMSPADYEMVMEAFNRTYEKLKKRGEV